MQLDNQPRTGLDETAVRRVNATASHTERPDLLVHALAQLTDNVMLELWDEAPDRPSLEQLARSYGILDRVRFERREDTATPPRIPVTMAELIQELSDPSDPPATCREQDQVFVGHKIAVVTNLPAPYRIPLLTKMSRRLRLAGAEFRVFFMGTGSRGRPWIGLDQEGSFDYEFLRSLEVPLGVRRPLVPVNLERRLSSFGPTIILAGSLSLLVSGRAARHARRSGAVFGIWSGEIAGRPTSASRLRRVQRRRLARQSDFAIAYGSRAGEYLHGLHPTLPFVYGRNTSDAYASDGEKSAESGTVRLLAVADMAKPGKGIDVLIDALRALPSLSCALTVVGPGAGASGLEERAEADDRISFTGALPQVQVRQRYAEADVFLFPSSAEADVFGLALIEAMGSGLAPVASVTPGAVADVGVDGWSCVVVREHTREAWAAAIESVVTDHDLRHSLADNAARTIRNRWTMDHACDAMIAGLRLGLLAAGRVA